VSRTLSRGGGRRRVLRGCRGGRAAVLPVRLSGGGVAGEGVGGGGLAEAGLLLGRLAGASTLVLRGFAHGGQAARKRKKRGDKVTEQWRSKSASAACGRQTKYPQTTRQGRTTARKRKTTEYNAYSRVSRQAVADSSMATV